MGESLYSAMQKMAADEFLNEMPGSQEECCKTAAKVGIAFNGIPSDFRAAAQALASGLFGDAYRDAGDKQKKRWNEICEEALREAASCLQDGTQDLKDAEFKALKSTLNGS